MSQWFKFYGGEYLADQKILALTGCERSCWITLLCYASTSEIPGEIKYLDEYKIMVMAGLNPTHDEWDETKGFLARMEKLQMIKVDDNGVITILNYRKRQDTALTNYERIKKFREKKRNDNEMITHDNEDDNSRREENRKEEKRIIETERGDKSPTPAMIAKDFFNNEEKRREFGTILAAKYKTDIKVIASEIRKFTQYWTELNKSGTRQRWETEKTFEVGRRLEKWFSNVKNFNKSNQPKESKTLIL